MATNFDKKVIGNKLAEIRRNLGLSVMMETASKLLAIQDLDNSDKKRQVNGEVCEIVLIELTKHYLEQTKHKASVYHSVVLPDLNNKQSDFRTELDALVVAESFCLTIECKSFVGDLHFTDMGTVKRKRGDVDVYRQSEMHRKVLSEYIKRLATGKVNLYSTCFMFSKGNMQDKRTAGNKKSFPLLTATNLFEYYNTLFSKAKTGNINYKKAQEVFSVCQDSDKLRQQHKEYLGY